MAIPPREIFRVNPIDEEKHVAVGLDLPLVNKNGNPFPQTYLTIDAAKANLKNLILTRKGERPFQPLLGSNIRALLFEPVDDFTAFDIEEQVNLTLQNFEPRVKILNIDVVSEPDNNRFKLSVEFQMITNLETGSVSFYLERIR